MLTHLTHPQNVFKKREKVNMCDDLVKRLRVCAAFDPDQAEAADRIEKLEAALDMSEKRFATLKDAWDTLRRRDMPPLYGSAALAGEKKNDG